MTKRILSIDGGGLRGVFSAAIIEQMELACGGKPACDIFDAFVGTSAGSYLAAGLASGMPAAVLKNSFIELGQRMSKLMSAGAVASGTDPHTARKLASRALQEVLMEKLGPQTRAHQLRKRLAVATRDMNQGRVVFFGNFPADQMAGPSFWKTRAEYNDDEPVWRMVMRSAALPPLFEPQDNYLDGGISPFANPCYAAYIGVQRCLGWNPWDEELRFYSVGTGYHDSPRELRDSKGNDIEDTALFSAMVGAMMQDINFLQHQLMKRQRAPGSIWYQRYNIAFNKSGFSKAGVDLALAMKDGKEIFDILASTATPEVVRLAEIGTVVGKRLVAGGHFEQATGIDPGASYIPFGAPAREELQRLTYHHPAP